MELRAQPILTTLPLRVPRKLKVNAKQKVLFLRAVMERSQELNVNGKHKKKTSNIVDSFYMHLKTCYIISGDQNLEANLIDHEVNDSSSVPQTKNYKKWLRISIYVFLVLACQALSTILGRL